MVQFEQWHRNRLLTASEWHAVKWYQLKPDSALADTVQNTLSTDPPYRWADDPEQRFSLFEFFFRRRMAFLLGLPKIENLPTDAEEHVRSQHMLCEISGKSIYALINELESDRALARTLGRKPYRWVPIKKRLDLLLFFYNRDIRTFPQRPPSETLKIRPEE